ncbi:hypothetical protein BGZ60DRAFT_569767 [Tricladium varicosporioides]|nr:hypothetical protein BGZ60DRAFT_569767 [Hymenoscyphus varicosporioides]
MALPAVLRKSVDDLWALAADQLGEEDKRNIDFSRSEKLEPLADLHALTEKSKQECIKKRWTYTRKSGETVILRDVFDKVIKWIDVFKQIGDVVVQYDPMHAALPWAGVRLVLQLAVNDHNKFGIVVEGLAWVAELICRHAVLEQLYLRQASKAAEELQRALVTLYATLLIYLSKAKQYLEQSTAKRIVKSALLTETEFDTYFNNIRRAQDAVSQCTALADKYDQIHNRAELKRLLADVDTPLRRMDDNLKNIQDDLQASKRSEILQWVSPEPYIQHHKQTKQDVLPGTGEWLLSDPVFKKWKIESASSVLWLHGIPGSGKSKLVSIVIEDALKSFRAGYTPQPVFFYCSRNRAEPGRSDPEAILASLARQLSCLEPGKPLLKPILDLYKKKETEGFASGSLCLEDSCALTIQLTEKYPLTTIVIDAFDECDPGKRGDLLKALERILQNSSGLVKIFVSSRDDRDIVFRFQHYPNLEIKSDRNSEDIAAFVKDRTERLIEDGELLQYSDSQTEMKKVIVEKVIEGAAGMFRWASMQLQYLCSFDMDADIRKNLGRLPPNLDTLYAELYEILSNKPGELQMIVFRNVLSWLLCAQRTLKSTEFLAAVSVIPQTSEGAVSVSKDLILKLCNNFVVFDAQLDTFRFAHLSVREFLEKRQKYTSTATNTLAAEVCLWNLISMSQNTTSKKFQARLGWRLIVEPSKVDEFSEYSDIHWAAHCQLAAGERATGKLKNILQFFVSDNGSASNIALWKVRLPSLLTKTNFGLELRYQLEDTEVTSGSISAAAWFVSCAFDLPDIMEYLGDGQIPQEPSTNKQGRSLLDVSVRHGSCGSLKTLLSQHRDYIQITEEVVKEATGNWYSGKEVIALLLDQRGDEVKITEDVVKAAAGNWGSGKEVMALLLDQRSNEVKITEGVVEAAARNSNKEVMALLLDQRGDEVKITEDVVKIAAGNWNNGKEVVALLLDQRGGEVKITEDVVKVAAGNWGSGKEVMALLLDQRSNEVKITEEVVIEAAGNYSSGKEVMALLLDQRGDEVKITEGVVDAAARNSNKEVMTLLLDQRGDEVKITEDVVKIAAGNWNNGEVVALLLDQRGDEVKITEDVVKAAAGNWDNGKEVMALLLDQRGDEIKITEEVVIEAARNYSSGKEVMALLLDQRGDEVKITEGVVDAAARNSNKEVMTLLLDQRDDEVKITEGVVEAAARNSNKEVMALLLDQRGDEVKITEDVVKAAARNSNKEVMTLLLDQRSDWIVVIPQLVQTLAESCNTLVMKILLTRCDDRIEITEEVAKAAARNSRSGNEVMALLLDQRGDWVVTPQLVQTLAESFNALIMKTLLMHYGDRIEITEDVVKAAAGNWGSGKEVIALLLDQRGDEVKITEDVVKAAARNWGSGKEVMTLLLDQRGDEVKITEEVVKEAAGNEQSGEEVIRLLHQTISIKVTCGVIEAAATCGQSQVLGLLDEWAGIGSEKEKWFKISRFYNAAKDGDITTVRQLLDEGISPDMQNIHGTTPLWVASHCGHLEVVKVLLATNAVDVNVRSVSRRTPLFWTAAYGHFEVIQLLLDHGARQDYTDKEGSSPLSIAQCYGRYNVVDILTKYDTREPATSC